MAGVKCPKCGLMQMARPTCKSCGMSLDGPTPDHTFAPSPAFQPMSPPPRPDSPSPARGGPIYRSDAPPPLGVDEAISPPPPRMPPTMLREAPMPFDTEPGIYGLFFHGSGGSLFGIHIVNILLTILTLGVYYFWGIVRVRNYVLSQTEFAGDRFAYHGTGKELLIGFLKAVLVFGVPIGTLVIAPQVLEASDVVKGVAVGIAYLTAVVFVPVAMVGARRYRMSRTSWRGIRFSFRGRVMDFVKIFIGGSLLSVITLGLYYPFFVTKQHAFMVSHAYFGNRQFEFDGQGRDLFGSYLLTLLLTLPTLGLTWFWFQAKKHRYFWDHTAFGGARFHSTVTGGRLLALTLGNFLLLIVTLGFGWPWVLVRNIQFTFRYLTLEGSLDPTLIRQDAQLASATGEGLASFLDLDTGFDFG